MTVKNSGTAHETHEMLKRALRRPDLRNGIHVHGACRLSKVGNFKFIGGEDYIAEKRKL